MWTACTSPIPPSFRRHWASIRATPCMRWLATSLTRWWPKSTLRLLLERDVRLGPGGSQIRSTGRLITTAAAIMATVFFGFALADLVVIKAVGIGMGIAAMVDVTVVRMLWVLATMRLLGRWNWWAPAPLGRRR